MVKRPSKGKGRKSVGGRAAGGKRGARAAPKARAGAGKAQPAKGRFRAAPVVKKGRPAPAFTAVTKRSSLQRGRSTRGIRPKPADELLDLAEAPSEPAEEVVGFQDTPPGVGAAPPAPPAAQVADLTDLPGIDDTPVE